MLRALLMSVFIFSFCQILIAQNSAPEMQFQMIDSLVRLGKLDEAEKQAELLEKVLINNPDKSGELRIRVEMLRADMLEQKEQFAPALASLLKALEKAGSADLPHLSFLIHLQIELAYEYVGNWEACKFHLDQARNLHRSNQLDSLYSSYCIRSSSYFYRTKHYDSALYYAEKSLEYANKYDNIKDLSDGHLLLGFMLHKAARYEEAIEHHLLSEKYKADGGIKPSMTYMYSNISGVYQVWGKFELALKYSDSSILAFRKDNQRVEAVIYKNRAFIFEKLGNLDSANFYLRLFHDAYLIEEEVRSSAALKKITEEFESEKKEAIIQSKNQWLVFIICVTVLITVFSYILYRRNRKIRKQNITIQTQVDELLKTVHQKKVLLAELQHRVKNNLQHVISILEIQKDSIDLNNIDELILENQNRIHSMALLHKKLVVADDVSTVDLPRYITELSELVRNSYTNLNRKVRMDLQCEIDSMSIEKALPIGLILVELISNSMKHAFKERADGAISISISSEAGSDRRKLYYADNGIGFDFNKPMNNGLGLEIVNGLVGQLDGSIESAQENGFQLIIYFK